MAQSQSYSGNRNSEQKHTKLVCFDRIGERLRELREDRDITQLELGKTLGYTQESISRKESGKRQLSGYEIIRFSQALQLSKSEILYLILGVRSD